MKKKVLFLVTILGLLALSLSVVVPALAAEPLRGGPATAGVAAAVPWLWQPGIDRYRDWDPRPAKYQPQRRFGRLYSRLSGRCPRDYPRRIDRSPG